MTLFREKYRVELARLKNWDYGANRHYFVTICTQNRIHFFGEISNRKVHLSAIGQTAQQYWAEIPNHFEGVYLDEYVIMPDHIHGILTIDRPFSSGTNQFAPLKPGSLPTIVQSYKSSVTRWCRKNQFEQFAWQPRFHDRILRDETALNRVRMYIVNNPAKWTQTNRAMEH